MTYYYFVSLPLQLKLQVHKIIPLPSKQQLTKGLQGLDQIEGEKLVFRQFFKHAGNFIVSYPDYVASINALNMVTHRDEFCPVHHTALFNALPGEQDND